jgi:hypothetical protein
MNSIRKNFVLYFLIAPGSKVICGILLTHTFIEVEKLGIDADEIFDFVDLNKNNTVSFQELIFWLR